MRQHRHAHIGQTKSQIQQIIRNALRDAALASTPNAAIDITGAALRAVADLARTEVSHG